MAPSADGSSTSRARRSRPSRPSRRASPTSGSPGSADGAPPTGLGAGAIRAIAARHGIRPTKGLGQHFLIDPNLARTIAGLAEAGPADRVLEIGAGLGSLTVALAATGAEVLAVELDRTLHPALEEVVGGHPRVRIVAVDATRADWARLLGDGPWTMCSNLPYNVGVPVTLDLLEGAPGVGRFVIMVQREVGERLVAGPGDPGYGAVSVRVAYRASAELLRGVPATVFWPRPSVGSVLVRLRRHDEPPVEAPAGALLRLVGEGFAERRKTMRNALRRLGLGGEDADAALSASGIGVRARAEELGLEDFDRLARTLATRGLVDGGDEETR